MFFSVTSRFGTISRTIDILINSHVNHVKFDHLYLAYSVHITRETSIEFGPHCEKTCLRGMRPGHAQISQLSYRLAKILPVTSLVYFQRASNKGADQTVRMHRLICAFVIRLQQNLVFSQ